MPRRLRLRWAQWVGMPLIALLPALSLAGVFGDAEADANAAVGPLAVRVQYPSRMVFQEKQIAKILVTNTSDRPLEAVVVHLDPEYVNGFADVEITPPPRESWEVELRDVGPHETRRVGVELHASRYFRRSGDLRVAAGADEVRIPLDTFVFP